MSIKKYFDVTSDVKSLAGTTAQKISSQVESVGYHEQQIVKEERYIPHADYSAPQGFARYGNAEEYYTQAIKRIYETFPYDGSLKERLQWENDSTYLDLYIYNDRYPRTNGYINFSAGGWGTPTGLVDGYGLPNSTADYEYIYVKGGPHPNPNGSTPYRTQFTGSNYYEPSKNRGSNFATNVASKGISLEFWLKKDAFDVANTRKEVVFDLWNGVAHPDKTYGRVRVELTASVTGLRPFMLTVLSGNTGVFEHRLGTPTITMNSIADGKWHHYAVTLKQGDSTLNTRFYIDGRLNQTQELSASGLGVLKDISGLNLRANIGALVGSPRSSAATAYAGKLSASLDEFRYWKAQRTSQEIGRFWFTQVGGGVNTDPEPFIQTEVSANLDLGVYFKFNEGITSQVSIDSTILDYSGRASNGAWTCPAITAGDFSEARNTGSAIVLSQAAIKEYKDPIIYPQHTSVQTLLTELQATGSSYDVNNNAAIYNTMPAWIIEEDQDGDGELRKLTQIIGSYFDTLHLQIKDLNTIKNVEYISGSNKPLPFAERLLNGAGLVAPEIFLDADILNVLASRSEDKVFEKPLEEVKNIIYKNIYNNLVYIFKSKGTEKGFRNLIRCFGIDDELVKLNMYANNVQFELRNNRRNIAVADRFLNFNTGDNKSATVFNYRDASNPASTGYISASAALANGHAITLESEILFPLKGAPEDDVYVDTNTISSSLFGVHGVQAAHAGHSDGLTTWATNDIVNFQVYAVRDEPTSDNVRFVVTSSSPRGQVPYLTSELYEDVYNNTRWNLSVRIKPEKYPLSSLVNGAVCCPPRTTGSYTVELHGVQGESGEILQEFTVSKTVTDAPLHFITGSRRVYVGAHRTNFTGSLLSYSDVRVNACRFWLDYVDDSALAGHVLDTQNFGTSHPHWFAYPFNPSSSYGDVVKADTLAFNWEFLTNTGSNASGQLTVPDLTSGSIVSPGNALTASYGELGRILNRQYTARGEFFTPSSTTAIDKDYVISSKLNLPENLKSDEMVKVLGAMDQDVFTSDSRPTNYSFAFEKSMYQVISEEMINYFATLRDFHNLIGDPVNQWRPEYKSINFMRQKFFETVGNEELDFDKFYEYYKWFDSTLSIMLAQLTPVSADVAPNVRTVIENHILERPKYQRKFPFLAKSDTGYPTARIDGNMGADKSAQASPEEFPQGSSFFTNTAFTRRQIGSSNTPQVRPWKHFHAPVAEAVSPGVGKSLEFDGSDDYVQQGTATQWNNMIGGAGNAARPMSISMWINPQSITDTYPRLFSIGGVGANARQLTISTATTIADAYFTFQTSDVWAAGPHLWMTVEPLSAGTWHHVVVTYEGGSDFGGSHNMVVYVDGAVPAQSTNTAGTAEAITGGGIELGQCPGGTCSYQGYMCDTAVWNKVLSAADVTEIYGAGKRVWLLGTSNSSNLVAWWRMGSDSRDSYDGTIYDQVVRGGIKRDATPTNFPSTALTNTESPDFEDPYGFYHAIARNTNMYWHRFMEEADTSDRTNIITAISQSFRRRTQSPVKFSAEGTTALGGVAKHHNSVVNYVFGAARAWTQQRLVSSGSTVEQLLTTPDVYYPTFKQRLGFAVSASANEAISGPRHAPFSLYSSSVTTGYNAEVVANYASGVMITNLHNDFVMDTDVPMQGPFPEQYVGGRFYRHTRLNQKGTDSDGTRGEGFRIDFDNGGSKDIAGVNHKSLVVLPPDSPKGVQNLHLPTAYRFREETAKRPVNIKNIQMRTGSTILGNYEKNYQVVNSNSRMKNDPFFNDQSFNFALYPETLATRGRFPLTIEKYTENEKDVQQSGYLKFKSAPGVDGVAFVGPAGSGPYDALGSHAQETISIWFSASKNTVQQEGPAWIASGYSDHSFPAQYGGEERVLFTWGGVAGGQDSCRRVFLKSGSNAAESDGAQGPRLGISFNRGTSGAGTNNAYYWISEDNIFTSPGWYHVVFSTDQLNWKCEDFLGQYEKADRKTLQFNGTDSNVNLVDNKTTDATWEQLIGCSKAPAPQNSFSVTFWMRAGAGILSSSLISFGGSGTGVVHALQYRTDDKVLSYWSDNLTGSIPEASQIPTKADEWLHVGMTFAGGTFPYIKLYSNGAFVSGFASSEKYSISITGSCLIGESATGENFSGSMCDMAIWNRVLTDDEMTFAAGYRGNPQVWTGPIRPDLNTLIGPTAPTAGNLIAFWPMGAVPADSDLVINDVSRCRDCDAGTGNALNRNAAPANTTIGSTPHLQGPAFMSGSAAPNTLTGYGTHQRYRTKGAPIYVNGASVATSSAFQTGSSHANAFTGSSGLYSGNIYGGFTAFAPIYGATLATSWFGQPFGIPFTGIGHIGYWLGVTLEDDEAPYAPAGGSRASSSVWVNSFIQTKTTASYKKAPPALCAQGTYGARGLKRGWVDISSSAPQNGFNFRHRLNNWWKPNTNGTELIDHGPQGGNLEFGHQAGAAVSESAIINYGRVSFSPSEQAAYGGGQWMAAYSGYTANCEGNLDYLIPQRTGSDSNQTIIVNRYAGSGYEVMSLGYMDPAHEELSVYNALPYHNLAIRNHGLSGNVPPDPIAAETITVVDQIGKNRGLDQRASLHCGPFGADAAFGPGVQPSSSYPALPSWHKTNRNAVHGLKEVTSCAGEFDGADTLVDIGTPATWEALVGGAGTAAKPFTLSAWVYPKSAGEGSTGNILNLGSNDRYIFWSTAGGFEAYMPGGTPGVLRSAVASFNKWYHVTATYTGGNSGDFTLYINGSKDHSLLDTQPVAPIDITTNNSTIGNNPALSATWDGYIQNCGIWDRALGSGEVAALYNGGFIAPLDITEKSLYSAPMLTKGLVGYYRLDSGVGDSTTSILNRAPVPAAGTTGAGTALALVTGVGPTTVAAAKTYDNLFVQHQIPRSAQQYSWVTSSINYGERIYGFPSPSALLPAPMSQLVTSSNFPYFGNEFKNNFSQFSGPSMQTPSVDIQSRTSTPHLTTYSGMFKKQPNSEVGSKLNVGTVATWDALIGGAAGAARSFTLSSWVYLTEYPVGGEAAVFWLSYINGTNGTRAMWISSNPGHEVYFFIDGSVTNGQMYSDATIPLNTWTHIACTYSGGTAGTMAIYINGRRVSTSGTTVSAPVAGSDPSDDYGANIGASSNILNYHPLTGFLSDVAVWGDTAAGDGALTDRQISLLYNNGSPINISTKLSDNLVAWYRFNPWEGSSISLNNYSEWDTPGINVASNGYVKNAVGTANTDGTAYRLRLRRFSPLHNDQLNNYLNNQNGPYGWPTWKQIRAGESAVGRALSKNNYIGQVIPPGSVEKLIRNPQGSMVKVGSVAALRPNAATLYYEPPINSKMGMVEFYLEDNTDKPNPNNNMKIAIPYGNNLEYFNHDGLNNRLGLTIDLSKPMIFDTIRDFVVGGSLSTVIRYSESMYPSTDNMYRARIRGRTHYNIDKIWNPVRKVRSADGGLTGSFGQVKGKLYTTMTGSNSSVWPLDGHMNFTTTSSVRPWDGAGQLMNSYSRYSASVSPNAPASYSGSAYEHGVRLGLQAASPTYAWRTPTGYTSTSGESFPVLAGDVKWTAGEEAGKDPYENYSTWAEHSRTALKDGSVVPEFRISQHLRRYYDEFAGNFLTDQITGLYEVSGASGPANSAVNGFFKTYSNSDFMKYFRVVDDSLNDQRSEDLKIERDRIKLTAKGLIKFLPYKGFYPAERTLEIATMFSQSYGAEIFKGANLSSTSKLPPAQGYNRNAYFRIFAEPFMSPGILYNTIKSGLAVNSCVLVQTGSWAIKQPLSASMDSTGVGYGPYQEGKLYYPKLMQLGTGSGDSKGFHIAKVPFETIQDPGTYFNVGNLLGVANANTNVGGGTVPVIHAGGRVVPAAAIYDTALPVATDALKGAANSVGYMDGFFYYKTGASLPKIRFNVAPVLGSPYVAPKALVKLTDPEGGYRYAIDNFLCETTNFFMNGITSLRSNREDQFKSVTEGSVYTSTLRLYRSAYDADDESRWDMYSRASAFGFPLATPFQNSVHPTAKNLPTFSHHLPPYYAGEATATFIYTASYDGKPTIDEIFSKMKISYHRDEIVPNTYAAEAVPNPGIDPIIPADKTAGRLNDPRIQIDSSFNLKEKIQEVPQDTNTQENYWLIQSKFETPILNFANLTQSSPPGAVNLITNQTSPANLITRGMWHQYGSPITASTAGVFAEIIDQGSTGNSLADIVGFQKGVTVRVGDPKKNAVLEEAIVAVPFMVKDNTRQFFSYTGTSTNTSNFANVETAMQKYVFPPRFDFVRVQEDVEKAEAALEAATSRAMKRRPSAKRVKSLEWALAKALRNSAAVQPALMYVFEFSAKIDETDIADMWQNLPPDIEEKMQIQENVVEDRELLRVMAANSEDVQWMVFKVKKRAKRDYDVYRRSLVTTDTTALAPKLRGAYSYNWPYDYFSLVELAQIDATVQWTSGDMQYEIDDDDMIVLDGRPPLRGTAGAPPRVGQATAMLPGGLQPPGSFTAEQQTHDPRGDYRAQHAKRRGMRADLQAAAQGTTQSIKRRDSRKRRASKKALKNGGGSKGGSSY